MSIPDFQAFFRPYLEAIADGKTYHISEVKEVVAASMNISDEARAHMLPSGTMSTFNNRVAWAKTYLKKADLLSQPQRAHVQITEKGLEVLKMDEKLNVAFLKQFDAFREFHEMKPSEKGELDPVENTVSTPEELLQNAWQEIRDSLVHEILDKVKSCTPDFFEKLVVDLMLAMGYGGSISDAGIVTPSSRDGGIDGLIKEDKLGLDLIYLQAKRWEGTVGRPEIEKFIGALAAHGANKGVFITTGRFSKEARDYIPRNDTRIIHIDGARLAQLMIEHNLGVSIQQAFHLKRMDTDYFEEA
jgi:restriction system protein